MLAKKPSFSMGSRIIDNRVYRNNLHSLHAKDTPGIGLYEPVNPNRSCFEDKAKLELIRATCGNPKLSKNGDLAMKSDFNISQ